MAVRLHAAGREQAALRIESLNALRRVDRLADGGDFPVFEEQVLNPHKFHVKSSFFHVFPSFSDEKTYFHANEKIFRPNL